MSCIFCRIVGGEIPAEIVASDARKCRIPRRAAARRRPRAGGAARPRRGDRGPGAGRGGRASSAWCNGSPVRFGGRSAPRAPRSGSTTATPRDRPSRTCTCTSCRAGPTTAPARCTPSSRVAPPVAFPTSAQQSVGQRRREPPDQTPVSHNDLADRPLVRAAFAQSIVRGLSDDPRWLSCRYLYDAEGSALFERITELARVLPDAHRGCVARAACHVAARAAGPSTLVELGAGNASKTRHLLRAWTAGGRTRYVPVDICADMLRGELRRARQRVPRR